MNTTNITDKVHDIVEENRDKSLEQLRALIYKAVSTSPRAVKEAAHKKAVARARETVIQLSRTVSKLSNEALLPVAIMIPEKNYADVRWLLANDPDQFGRNKQNLRVDSSNHLCYRATLVVTVEAMKEKLGI